MTSLIGLAVIVLAGLIIFGAIGFMFFLLFVVAEGYLDPGEEDMEKNNINNNLNKR